VEDLQAAACDPIAERERNTPQPGGELLVRQAGDEQRPACVGHVGDGRGADRLTQDADRALAELKFLPLVGERERDVKALVVLAGASPIAAAARGTSSGGTSAIEPSAIEPSTRL
jgi:hypothetical protein